MDFILLSALFLVLCGVSMAFNYMMLKWSRTLGRKNESGSPQPRWSNDYKPAIGGVSFFIVFLIALLAYNFKEMPDLLLDEQIIQLGVIAAVTLGFFTGLADDAFNTMPWLKFGAQVACGLILLLSGLRIEFFGWYWLDALLTVWWTVSVMNSINMLDNMDGIATIASIGILICAAVTAFPVIDNNLFFTYICGGTVAALLGFLVFNWNPSKIFMGDTGSQMLGALLAAVGIAFFWNNQAIESSNTWYAQAALVMTAFVIPIGDSISVTINRLSKGNSPFVGGRDHTTHHLSYAGLSDKQVGLVMISISGVSLFLISGFRIFPEINHVYYSAGLITYALVVIGFLFSTTHWKKSKSAFKSSDIHSTT